MIEEKDFRLRADPGPEYPWHVRIIWQHAPAELYPDDLKDLAHAVGDIHDAFSASA